MAVTGDAESDLIVDEVGPGAIILTPSAENKDAVETDPPDTRQEARPDTNSRGESRRGSTEIRPASPQHFENGHVPSHHGSCILDPRLHDNVILDNYEVPAHVLNFTPPDRGCRAWIVAVASFLCNGIIFGTINSSGIVYDVIVKKLEEEGDKDSAFKASLMMSLAIGSTFLMSVVAGVLTDKLGIRLTTFIGGALATAGMFISSFFYEQIEVLMVTYGLMFGIGASLAYTPSLVILGHYFQRWMGLVNGFVTAGSSVFTIAMPFILPVILEISLQTCFHFLAGLSAVLMVAALVFKPLMPHMPPPKREQHHVGCAGKCRKFLGHIINVEIWHNKRYVIWTLAIPSALFGYFVPYVHLVKYAKIVLGEDVKTEVLVQCMGATSFAGRLIFGLIADRPSVNRIFLQQLSFFFIGTLTLLLTFAGNFGVFIAIVLGMGLFDGCFISLLGPVAFDLVGPAGASQAIGCLLAMCSIPLTLGPAIAGKIYDSVGSYTIPFICAGIPPIIGSFVLFSISCVKAPPQGAPGSPVREVGEKQNNATAATNSEDPRETHKLMSAFKQKRSMRDYQVGSTGEPQPAVLSPDLPPTDESVKVDVRRLAMLQRESCV